MSGEYSYRGSGGCAGKILKVNTGCRDEEVCGLQWAWEVAVPELGTSVLVIPANRVKNGKTRLVVLNRVAQR